MTTYLDIVKQAVDKDINPKIFEARSKQSLDWYRKKIKQVFGETMLNLDNNQVKTQLLPKPVLKSFIPGHFYSFKYSPKGKLDLPYYDRFPLILLIKKVDEGFLGLNMHYLHPIDRALFMDKLYELEVPDTKNSTLRINITYPKLQDSFRLRYYKACIKRYRYTNIGNFFLPIEPSEWNMALFLPTEQFMGEKRINVWKESKRKY